MQNVRIARQAAIEERPELLAESRRLRLAECSAAWSADAVLTHSIREAAWLRRAVPAASVYVVALAVPVRPVSVPFADRRRLACIVNPRHEPDIDVARFLVEEIMPLVWRSAPKLACVLVGDHMPETIKRLARSSMMPVQYVIDMNAAFDRVRLTVAPLRYGAGAASQHVTARRFAPPPPLPFHALLRAEPWAASPKVAFVAGLRCGQLPNRTACQLPGQPTIARVGLAPTR